MERKPYQRYEESYKLKVVKYYFDHGQDRKSTLEEFCIDHANLRDWLKKYPNEKKVITLLSQMEKETAKNYKVLPADPRAAQLEYERMQRELEIERMRSVAFSKMIDLAEQEYKLPIRKKSGTKQ